MADASWIGYILTRISTTGLEDSWHVVQIYLRCIAQECVDSPYTYILTYSHKELCDEEVDEDAYGTEVWGHSY